MGTCLHEGTAPHPARLGQGPQAAIRPFPGVLPRRHQHPPHRPGHLRHPARADAWLARQRAALDAGTWRDPGAGTAIFAGYARTWLAERELKPRTEADYRTILDRHLIPAFGTVPLRSITPALVRSWYATLDPAAPVMRAHTRHPVDEAACFERCRSHM